MLYRLCFNRSGVIDVLVRESFKIKTDSQSRIFSNSCLDYLAFQMPSQQLINLGVSAEALKLIMRHSSFTTTEEHNGALHSAQSAATVNNNRSLSERATSAAGRRGS